MRITPLYQLLLLAFITLGIYYPTLFVPFNLLDDQVFVSHLLNQKGFSWSRHFSPGGTYNFYRPLLSLSFEIDKYIGGLLEPFMHFINILVHFVNVALVWLLARCYGKFIHQESQWLPFAAALLFAIHPLNTEAVNWIAGRADLLAGTFVFISLYALVRFLEKRNLWWGIMSALALLGGALCKETALFLVPGALFLLICHKQKRQNPWRLRWVLPALYGISVLGYFVLRWGAYQNDRGLGNTTKLAAQMVGATPTGNDAVVSFPWLDAIIATLKVSGFYTFKLFQPLPLNFAINKVEQIYILPGIILAIGLLVIIVRRRATGWLFLVSASIAVSALVVLFTKLAWTPVAERYMYIPSGPFVVGCVYSFGRRFNFFKWERVATLLVFGLVVFWGGQTVGRNIIWQDNLTLYQDSVSKSPDFAPAKNQLALALKKHGRHEEANRILASNSMPKEDAASLNVAATLMEEGDYAAAKAELDKFLRVSGELNNYQKNRVLEMLIKITTQYLESIENENLKRHGYEDILIWLEQITEMSPTGFNYYRIGRVHLILNDKEAAQQAFAEAARRLPEDSLYKKPASKLANDLSQ